MDVAFVTSQVPANLALAAPALRAHATFQSQSQFQPDQSILSSKACLAVCGLAAAAGLASNRRRTALKAAVDWKKPEKSYWNRNVSGPWRDVAYAGVYSKPKIPIPNSQKMLETMVGADVETGSVPWDPLGFSKLFDRNFDFNEVMTYPHVQYLREAELKHGRLAMLAFVGILVQSVTHIPGYPSETNWLNALNAAYADKNASLGVVQISIFAMIVEGKFYPHDGWCGQMDREPGDLGFDPLGFTKKPGFDMKSAQMKELKNGRLAMIAFAAFLASANMPGSVPGLGASALRRDSAVASSSALCGKTLAVAQPQAEASKTAARYTTQVILPSLAWIRTGLKATGIKPCELKAVTLAGNDILLGKTEAGKLFGVGNLCPHIGTPMSEGADVIGDVIVCPLHGSSFKVTTGELLDWCVSPPIIGPLTGLLIEKKNLLIFEVRESGIFGGGDIEVLVDTNAKKAYEADYWKGLLDAQGKDDGSFY
ncbi:unnamed protein product [Polarella glacialis]|uniref:Rieske domain-containing protein n=1 Tax=Polarella glacialis TaxID=89957 RepID=A0A813LUT7_POLGL|nr:unnamed protein product [Polarella glacialis]